MRVDTEKVYMRVSLIHWSTFIAWSNENKSCTRVDKREFTWEFHQLSLPWSNENKSCTRVEKREFTWEFHQLSLLDQTRTRVAWELTSESLHESYINFHCLIKREQELHESWQARVYIRVTSTFIAWSNENKSGTRVDKREFTWEFHQLSLLDQTRTRVTWKLTSESLHESFINFHYLVIKREQELHESWQARVYMRVSSTFIAWLKQEQELHESWQARVYMRVSSTFIAWLKQEQELHENMKKHIDQVTSACCSARVAVHTSVCFV